MSAEQSGGRTPGQKRTRQPRGCRVRFALTSRWQLTCLSNWASSCSCCQRIISLAFYANVSNKEVYTAPKEVQDILRMAKGKTRWEGASKIGNSYLPGGSPNQKMDSQLHAIELLGNTGNELALKTPTKWYTPKIKRKFIAVTDTLGNALYDASGYPLPSYTVEDQDFPNMPGNLGRALSFRATATNERYRTEEEINAYRKPSASSPVIHPGDEAPLLVWGGEGSALRAAMRRLTEAGKTALLLIKILFHNKKRGEKGEPKPPRGNKPHTKKT